MKKIVVFASGSGTNAENIIKYFRKSDIASVTLLLSNNKEAKVLERAKKLLVPSLVFTKNELNNTDLITKTLNKERPDLIVLAGFLLKFPENILNIFSNKVINIHPMITGQFNNQLFANEFWNDDRQNVYAYPILFNDKIFTRCRCKR